MALVTFGALAAGCGSAGQELRRRPQPAGGGHEPARAVAQPPARLFVLPELQPQATRVADLADGTRQIVVRGMRMLDHPDGSLERATELLPARGTLRPLALPTRLGSGFVFALDSAGATELWRAPEFIGALTPLARVELEVEQIVPGFDRLYLVERRTRDLLALDVETGRTLDRGSLPVAAGYGAMAFADAWLGAVQVPYRGILASFDAGASWNPLASGNVATLALDSGQIIVTNAEGAFALDDSGALRPHGTQKRGDALLEDLEAAEAAAAQTRSGGGAPADEPRRIASGMLGRRPLVEAVLRGARSSPDSALVAAQGALVQVRLSDGKLMDVVSHAYPGSAVCQGIELGAGIGFVCGEERGQTVIYAANGGRSLAPVLGFPDARFVAASGNGGLVVRGPCASVAADTAPGIYCVRSRRGSLREVRVRGDLGVERLVTLADDRVAVIVPPRLGAPGVLALVSPNGSTRRVRLDLSRVARTSQALLRKGLWLNGFVEGKTGELLGWVAAAGPFAGVRVHLDGRVEVARPEHDIDRALLAGPYGMVFGAAGVAAQTIDNGFTWREVELPSDLLGDDSLRQAELVHREQGCSALGCVFGPWLRVGWNRGKAGSPLTLAATPPNVARPSPGGGRWALRCAATGEHSAPAAVPPEEPPGETYGYGSLGLSDGRGNRRRGLAQASPEPRASSASTWPGSFDLPAPRRRAEDVSFHLGTEHKAVQLHGYAWSGRGASWDRAARWQILVSDPFSVRGAWSTLPTRTPWADALVAGQVFGADSSAASNWEATLDARERNGVLVIGSRGTVELFLLEEERPIVSVQDPARFGFFSVAGVAKLGTTWFLGAEVGTQTFRILRVDGNQLRVVGEYPLHQLGRGSLRTSLVRSTAGNRLGIWSRGMGWHVFPVNVMTGQLGAPLEISPAQLSRVPRVCGADDEGWLLKTQPSETSRDLLEPSIHAGEMRVRNVEVRLVANALDTCLDALSARAEGEPSDLKKTLRAGATVLGAPLTLSERRAGGRRWGLRCSAQ